MLWVMFGMMSRMAHTVEYGVYLVLSEVSPQFFHDADLSSATAQAVMQCVGVIYIKHSHFQKIYNSINNKNK